MINSPHKRDYIKSLVAEDDFLSREVLKCFFPLVDVDLAVNRKEAVRAFNLVLRDNTPYAIIFMDIMMPELDGFAALKAIIDLEQKLSAKPAKVLTITALGNARTGPNRPPNPIPFGRVIQSKTATQSS